LIIDNIVKALKGAESLLLILPKDAANKLNIENHDYLKFEVRNRELVIKKIVDEEVRGGNKIE
jgi:antitoxin component of MazEF toxin-antitoxin module